MISTTSWDQLSSSSRQALQWAVAVARCRAVGAGEDPGSAQAGPFDLLIGLMLSHPSDSEPEALLAHFSLVPGQLLPEDARRLSVQELEHQLTRLPPPSGMTTDPDVDEIVESGVQIGMSSGSTEVAELRAIFAALLRTPNDVAAAFDDLLGARGASLSEISELVLEYVQGEEGTRPFGDFLRERRPYSPMPVDIPNYKADHGVSATLADDLVDIRAEVDAFAYLIASRGLTPPLAIGLFGDWGSGKSFFMDAVRERIDQLTSDAEILARPQAEVPYWKRVVQISFNAWHYVEGELWASLVEHIFSQLRLVSDGEDEDIVTRRVNDRRRYWLGKLESTRMQLARLQAERSQVESRLREKREQAELLRRQRNSELEHLERLKAESVTRLTLSSSIKAVREALAPAFVSLGLPTPEETIRKLEDARGELTRGRAVLDLLWRSPRHLFAVGAALVAVPAVVWFLDSYDFSAVVAGFGGLTTAVVSAFSILGNATTLVRRQLDVVDEAEHQVRKEIAECQKEWDRKIEALRETIDSTDKSLERIVNEEDQLSKDLDQIETKLDRVSPAQILNEFVSERGGSDDYRKRLGVPALIQRDFEQLAALVKSENERYEKEDTGNARIKPHHFNRIVLYIDDLDRCPDKRVVDVLQAVHLLLAFDLFVVVVAVDSRWLDHALTKHYEALVVGSARGNHATSDDYLEKIFQVPFWVEPLNDDARRRIVGGLLRGHLAASADGGEVAGDGDHPSMGPEHRRVLAALDSAAAPPALTAAALAITREELAFLDELAPLLGGTPRAVKRFVNIYQLVRTIHRAGAGVVEGPAPVPPDHEVMAFVLAVGDGLPHLGPSLLHTMSDCDAATLAVLIGQVAAASGPVRAELRRLESWLSDRDAEWQNLPCDRIGVFARLVERFLFRVGGHYLGETAVH